MTGGRSSLDIQSSISGQAAQRDWASPNVAKPQTPEPKTFRSTTFPTSSPKPGAIRTAPASIPPQVTVDSPKPSAHFTAASNQSRTGFENASNYAISRSQSPQISALHSAKVYHQSNTHGADLPRNSAQKVPPAPSTSVDSTKSFSPGQIPSYKSPLAGRNGPPPINRAGKPQLSSQAHFDPEAVSGSTLAPNLPNETTTDAVSPFNTPPSSDSGGAGEDSPTMQHDNPSFRSSTFRRARDNYFAPPKEVPSISAKIRNRDAQEIQKSPQIPPSRRSTRGRTGGAGDLQEDLPGLPARRESSTPSSLNASAPVTEDRVRRSMDAPTRPAEFASDRNFPPPPRRAPTLGLGAQPNTSAMQLEVPLRSDSRASSASRGSSAQVGNGTPYADDNEPDDAGQSADGLATAATGYPDATRTYRRPPRMKERPWEINTKYDTKLLAVSGEYVCTTGFITRVWSLRTGELLLNLTHSDAAKITAVAFKPAKSLEDEGKRLWLGTNNGEINELDIPVGSIVQTKANAHARREILRIYRNGSEMWSLDDDAKLHVWMADRDGVANLSSTPYPLRLPKGHTFSLVVGNKLWFATGKEIRVFRPNSDNTDYHVLQEPLSQPGVGEITSGAILGGQPDRVYFGHADGKVTIYSRNDYSCLGVINVSLYKISSMVGVGDYLWAGYNTGMVYVYDTRAQPWKVLKDWKAHEHPIASLVVDKSSIWKMDRFQVLSLGTDNMIQVWDGMLRDDWLGMNGKSLVYHDVADSDPRVATGATRCGILQIP